MRLRAVGFVAKPPLPQIGGPAADAEPVGERPVLLPDATDPRPVAVYRRDRMAPGISWEGPAIVEESSSTTLVLECMSVAVDPHGNLIVTLQDPE